MTDKEIKKALECCMNGRCDDECPFRETREHCHNLDSLILDLINRQQAQIDRLMKECGNQSVLWQRHFDNIFESAKRTTKSEAIKEFAKRLKECCRKRQYVITERTNFGVINKRYLQVVDESDIDTLVNEMTGETKTDTDFPKDYSYGY